MSNQTRTKPLKVQWASNEDLQCAILAGLGFSTKMIMERTGLTACQVTYRLHKAEIKRADYRNGESAMAQRIIERSIPSRASDIRSIMDLPNPK